MIYHPQKFQYHAAVEMSELFDKSVNAQKEKTSRVHTSSLKPCAMLHVNDSRHSEGIICLVNR